MKTITDFKRYQTYETSGGESILFKESSDNFVVFRVLRDHQDSEVTVEEFLSYFND